VLPDNVYPIGFMADQSFFIWETFWNVAASFGADYFKPGTWEPVFDSPEAINAANFIAELFEKGYAASNSLYWDYARQLEAWNKGRLAMCFQYPIQESYNPKTSKIADEPRYHSILPKGPGPKGRRAVHGTTTNVLLAMNKMSNKKDAAFIWMAFNCSAEVQYIYTVTGTGIDYGRKSIFANKTANMFYPNAQASYETIPYVYNDLQIAPREEILQTAIPVFNAIFTQQAKAEQALPELNKRVRKVMERDGYLSDNPPVPAPKSFWNWDLYPEYRNMKWEDGVGK
jgi:ABC-type glycerol-3-phosphate transport system substrate-binding protein